MFNESHIWTGQTGTPYSFDIYPLTNWPTLEVPAIYIYCAKGLLDWIPIYVGQTGDISDRTLAGQHKQTCIQRNNATHLHVYWTKENELRRQIIEGDLIVSLGTENMCNG